jgi:Peptidase family C25
MRGKRSDSPRIEPEMSLRARRDRNVRKILCNLNRPAARVSLLLFASLCVASLLLAPSARAQVIKFRAASSGGAPSGTLTLTVARPAGTALNDVLIAAVAVRPSTATITAPAGWTLVRRTNQAATNSNSQAIYSKVAGASEPASYSWTFNTSTGSVGGILGFSGVNTASPIDANNGQADPNGLTFATPSINTTVKNDMIVTAHSFSSAATWTAPAGMTKAVDVASVTPQNAVGESMCVNYALQGSVGATGTKTATAASNTDVGVGQILALKSATPTEVKLSSFTATEYPGGQVIVRWRTGFESHNLGFHLYRESSGQRVEVTPSLVAGSALFAGTTTTLRSGWSYAWRDVLPPNSPSPQYWLEDVDLNGERTLHGPVTPAGAEIGSAPPALSPAPLLRGLGMRPQPDTAMLPLVGSAASAQANSVSPQALPGLPARLPTKLRSTSTQLQTQWALAAGTAIKIGVRNEGWYRITQPALVAAGLDPNVNPRDLQLFVDGQEIPITVRGGADGLFGPQDDIEFYGLGLDTPWTDTHTYWLVAGSQPGKRVAGGESQPGVQGRIVPRPGLPPFRLGGQLNVGVQFPPNLPEADVSETFQFGQHLSGFPFTVERKDRSVFFAALKNGDAESFFGPVISANPLQQTLNVQHLAASAPGEAQLEIALQGATDGPHQVSIQFNGFTIQSPVFSGQEQGITTAQIPQAWLHEGPNQVVLTGAGGDTDVSLVDHVRLSYWHAFTADGDVLEFTALGGQALTLHGFSDPRIRVMDITDPQNIEALPGVIRREGTGYWIAISVQGAGNRTLLAFSEASIQTPSTVTPNHPSNWRDTARGYDEVILTNAAFLDSLKPLQALRQQQGLSAAIVDVQDIYDEFSFGAKDPAAIKNFLAAASINWINPPRFVLLVGDASFDPRNYLGLGDFDFLPTKLVQTSFLKTASDDWYVDANGDDVPEIPIGRLPVRTVADAQAVVSKIVGYEQGDGTGNGAMNVLLVTDYDTNLNFEAVSSQVKSLLPGGAQVTEIQRGQTDDATASSTLLAKLNDGQTLVNYVGHGSVELWQGNLLTSEEAGTLTNGSHLSFVVTMTCLNGYFQDLYTESLSEALLLARNGGAVAVWASSGLTDPAGQATLDPALIGNLSGSALTIGEATIVTKKAVTDPDIRRTWILFGDPATKLKW